MRYAAKTDANQREIVDALRACGWSVQCLHRVGQGCPDLLVGVGGRNVLLEVKSGDGELTGSEPAWHAEWRGQVAIVRTVEEAIAAVSAALTN